MRTQSRGLYAGRQRGRSISAASDQTGGWRSGDNRNRNRGYLCLERSYRFWRRAGNRSRLKPQPRRPGACWNRLSLPVETGCRYGRAESASNARLSSRTLTRGSRSRGRAVGCASETRPDHGQRMQRRRARGRCGEPGIRRRRERFRDRGPKRNRWTRWTGTGWEGFSRFKSAALARARSINFALVEARLVPPELTAS